MRVFVAGAGGSIGRRLLPRLVGAGPRSTCAASTRSSRARTSCARAAPTICWRLRRRSASAVSSRRASPAGRTSAAAAPSKTRLTRSTRTRRPLNGGRSRRSATSSARCAAPRSRAFPSSLPARTRRAGRRDRVAQGLLGGGHDPARHRLPALGPLTQGAVRGRMAPGASADRRDRPRRRPLRRGRRLDLDGLLRRAEVNGQPGAMFLDPSGRLISVMTLEIADGLVQTVRSVVNPDKLRHLRPLADVRALLRRRAP
jgi:hypothetical protein